MKKASVSLIAALMLLFSFTLTGCTLMGRDDTTPTPKPTAAPTASPSPEVTPETTPDTTPEINDNDMPGTEDGIVKDEDGIITDDDTGNSTTENGADESVTEKAGRAIRRGMGN